MNNNNCKISEFLNRKLANVRLDNGFYIFCKMGKKVYTYHTAELMKRDYDRKHKSGKYPIQFEVTESGISLIREWDNMYSNYGIK